MPGLAPRNRLWPCPGPNSQPDSAGSQPSWQGGAILPRRPQRHPCASLPARAAGRSSGRPPAPSSRLDRSAFEVAVADAAELLQAQLRSVGGPAGRL